MMPRRPTTWSFTAALVLMANLASANLILNPSFEEIPGAIFGQGVLPSDWLQAGDINPGADTFSVDGTYGLAPGDGDHWLGQSAQDGKRWVAGADFSGLAFEAIGQELSAPLVVGETYDLSGYIKNDTRATSSFNGGFEVLLAESGSILAPHVLLGAMTPATSAFDWQLRSFSFVAPAEVASWDHVIFKPFAETPGQFVYVSLDSVSLTRSSAMPEPGTLGLVGAALIGLGLVGPYRRGRRTVSR